MLDALTRCVPDDFLPQVPYTADRQAAGCALAELISGRHLVVTEAAQSAISGPQAGIAAVGDGRGGWDLRIHTIGPFLVEIDSRPVVIHSRKAQGLLALLALAPRGQRTRVWLRDKLWSGSDERRAATSLRQTLFDLRQALGSRADGILQVDRITIGLRLDRVWVDMRALGDLCDGPGGPAASELLEGFEVDDEEFEDWLRQERQIWDERRETLTAAGQPWSRAGVPTASILPPKSDAAVPAGAGSATIGFLPSIVFGCDGMMQFVADRILEGIAGNLQEIFALRIIDYRDATQTSSTLMESSETEFYMRVRLLQVREQATVTFLLYRASRMSLEWCQSFQASVSAILADTDALLSGFIAQNVDRISRSLCEIDAVGTGEAPASGRAAFAALNMMFRLDERALANAGEVLNAAQAASRDTLLPSLQSYLASFVIGEFFKPLDNVLLGETRQLVEKAMAGNPFNSIALACLGHVTGYVFGEQDLAHELLERAVRLNPSQAFAWDHFALHKLYTGDPAAAYAAAQTAVRLGRYSPIAYSYETTLSMAATLIGDHRRATVMARSALTKQPRFAAAMRYHVASLSHLGRVEEARAVYQRLLAVDPGFADPAVRPSRFRIADPDTQASLLQDIGKVLG